MVEVYLIALNSSESSPGNFVVVLEEIISKKRMAITIGGYEAQAIAISLERMQLPRPMLHDIFKNTIAELGGTLIQVHIYAIVNQMYHAYLIIKTKEANEIKIDARASDALAMAVRYDCPIYVDTEVFEKSVITEVNSNINSIRGSLADYSLEELKLLLQNILAKEDYESAGRIRDMIKKRKENL
ncbi:MAG: bifunctional nuclease family protein [Lacibacter sp.]|jgi:uncharacterized protein